MSGTGRNEYLDLLETILIGADRPRAYIALERSRNPVKRMIKWATESRGFRIVKEVPRSQVEAGHVWPLDAASMIGRARMHQLRTAVETVVAEDIPGDLIETGVWRGGAGVMMRATLEAAGDETRSVFLADSFEGLPPEPGSSLHSVEALSVTEQDVRATFERFGLLDQRVTFVKGWFKDTLPALRDHQWSLVRLDGDLYTSTMDGLTSLYPSLTVGGFLIVDDYGALEECRRAVDEYRASEGIADSIQCIDDHGIYWRKESG